METGSQRALLAWIGYQMWKDHPVLGLGFERSNTDFAPYLPAAHERFPNLPDKAFPGPWRRWGVQNYWLELLADTGAVGFLLGIATFATGIVTALRQARKPSFLALAAAGFILVAVGAWNAVGIIAGIPMDAVTWLGFGLAGVALEVS